MSYSFSLFFSLINENIFFKKKEKLSHKNKERKKREKQKRKRKYTDFYGKIFIFCSCLEFIIIPHMITSRDAVNLLTPLKNSIENNKIIIFQYTSAYIIIFNNLEF